MPLLLGWYPPYPLVFSLDWIKFYLHEVFFFSILVLIFGLSELFLSKFLKKYSLSYPINFYRLRLASPTIPVISITVFSEHFLLISCIASVIPLSDLLSVQLDWLFLNNNLLLVGAKKDSSSSAIVSRVKLYWVVEISLRKNESLYFSMNLEDWLMSSSYFCINWFVVRFMNWAQISYWRSREAELACEGPDSEGQSNISVLLLLKNKASNSSMISLIRIKFNILLNYFLYWL